MMTVADETSSSAAKAEAAAELNRRGRNVIALYATNPTRAGEEFYALYHDSVFRFCKRIVRKQEDAEDACAETFIKAFKALGKYNPQYSLKSWLFQIAHNSAVDILRKEKRRNALSLDTLIGHAADEDPEYGRLVHESVLAPALNKLRPKDREMVLLAADEDYTQEEIAGIMGMELSAYKSALRRARLTLKDIMNELCAETPIEPPAAHPEFLPRRRAEYSGSSSGQNVIELFPEKTVTRKGRTLTPRELRRACMAASGLTNPQIAAMEGGDCTVASVAGCIQSTKMKLRIQHRNEIGPALIARGLWQPPGQPAPEPGTAA